MKKRFAALLTAAALVISAAPAAIAEGTKDVVVTVEKFTLGAGYIVEPTIVTVSDSATASDAVFKALNDLGLSAEDPDYITSVEDHSDVIDIPDVLVTAIGAAVKDPENGWDYIDDEKQDPDFLQAEDYYVTAGWTYSVNNEMASVGIADYKVEDSDIIRLQFTLYGWGEDIAPGMSWGMYPKLEGVEFANKDDLIMEIAMLRASYDDETLKANDIYNFAYQTAIKFGATQDEVDTAAAELLEADFESAAIDVRTPYLAAQEIVRGTDRAAGAEWYILAAARGEYPYDAPENEEFFASYYDSVVNAVKQYDGLPKKNAANTDVARTIIGVTAAGYDAQTVGGYNLFEKLADFSFAAKNLNGAVYTLIALDTHAYELPETSAADKTTRDKLIDYILGKEISGGGWAFSGTNPDPDMTAMSLQALAPYYDMNSDVKAAADRAVGVLAAKQGEDGLWTSWGNKTVPSAAQVLTALCALGIDPDTDERFIKGSKTIPEIITDFAVDGGYKNKLTDTSANVMATQQSSYALAAYYRLKDGKNSLYDMTDVVFRAVGFEAAKAAKDERFDDPEKGAFADTYIAKIDLDKFESVSGLNWLITNTEGSSAAVAFDSPVLTGGTYVYGLVISGTQDQLDTISGVKLVNAE